MIWTHIELFLELLGQTLNSLRLKDVKISLYTILLIVRGCFDRTHMRGRIWLLLQVSSPAALFPRVCWECVKACQTVGDQLIIASYWGPG